MAFILLHEIGRLFGINDNSDLIQSPVIMQLYSQSPLTLYQIEAVLVPKINTKNGHANSYTEIQTSKPYISLNDEKYISHRHQELRSCKYIGYRCLLQRAFHCKM